MRWARDNGSVAAAWPGTEGNDVQVSHTHGFEAGNRVELSHDALASNRPPPRPPCARRPAGIEHHDAPPGFLAWNDGQVMVRTCRCEFAPLANCP